LHVTDLSADAFNLRTNVAHFRHQASLSSEQISLLSDWLANRCTETCNTFLHRADIPGQVSHISL
jgi:hypothetical protein